MTLPVAKRIGVAELAAHETVARVTTVQRVRADVPCLLALSWPRVAPTRMSSAEDARQAKRDARLRELEEDIAAWRRIHEFFTMAGASAREHGPLHFRAASARGIASRRQVARCRGSRSASAVTSTRI